MNLLTLLAMALVAASPQDACAECQIDLEFLVTLGSEEDMGFVGEVIEVAAARDHYYVVLVDDPAHVRVFSESGAFVRLMGNPGQGPGETRRLSGLQVDSDGTQHWLDAGLYRYTKIDPEGRISTLPLSMRFWGPPALTVLPDGGLVLNGVNPLSSAHTLHIIESDGSYRTSFSPLSDTHPARWQWTTTGPDGNLWSAAYDVPGIKVWSTSGTLLKELEVPTTTFDARWDQDWVLTENGPTPAQMDISVSEDVVWLLQRLPAREWKKAVYEQEN